MNPFTYLTQLFSHRPEIAALTLAFAGLFLCGYFHEHGVPKWILDADLDQELAECDADLRRNGL